MFTRISAVIACILTVVWLSRHPDWEPLAAFVSALLFYMGIEIVEYRKQQQRIRATPSPPNIVVHSAFWHTADHRKDVAETVRALTEAGVSKIPADIRLFGDPHHGTVKTLTIQYSIGNQKKTKEIKEHGVFAA